MKRCTTCNRTYTDESLLFCADDGTQLVSEAAPAEPFNASPLVATYHRVYAAAASQRRVINQRRRRKSGWL